jgi:hypothetical protein
MKRARKSSSIKSRVACGIRFTNSSNGGSEPPVSGSGAA